MICTGCADGVSCSILESMSSVTSPVSPKAVDWYWPGNRTLANRGMSLGCMASSCLFKKSKCDGVKLTRAAAASASAVDDVDDRYPASTSSSVLSSTDFSCGDGSNDNDTLMGTGSISGCILGWPVSSVGIGGRGTQFGRGLPWKPPRAKNGYSSFSAGIIGEAEKANRS